MRNKPHLLHYTLMQVTKKTISDTKVQLTMAADNELMQAVKQETLRTLAKDVKVQGFRPGKAPLPLVEKQLNPALLQSEFLDRAMNRLYSAALIEQKLRPVAQPEVKITKFVPFETLEVEATVEVVGEVKLPDYKKIKLAKEKVAVSAKDLDEVINQLKTRDAERKEVNRGAKNGDQVIIDFKGSDAKTKEPIKGGEGKEYPLTLGSNSFIPGFETNLVGVKPGETKEFTLAFPKDYGVKALQNRKVTFVVTVGKVQEIVDPTLDDAFAAKVGPFKTLQELKDDIKKQLLEEKTHQADQKYNDTLITQIAEKAKVAIPDALIDEQIERIEREERQSLMYRGQTWQEFLESEGLTEESYRKKQRPVAELRVKAGLVLADIAEAEKIEITPEEFNAHIQALKARYTDAKMQEELNKPENRRDIISRLLTEKTIARLAEYASSK